MTDKKENIVETKSFDFALRIVNLYKYLKSDHSEYVLSKQILRSGTSIGANISESISGISKADFVHKLSISLKEARETLYWLKLLNKSEYIDDKLANSLINDCDEIIRLLFAIIRSSKSNS
ncbi:four helix bundle protein [Marivirga atlantica]|jgi:four helix bundle protein|uniref:Four helix bundle protein n=1 Tax=Marivirga atlantica TaxID=1548457 RepID=A0A937ADU2_9BACT|nr:four helix bundle protein [Marivirga atlantica]MBL0766980.1 four helix bundle protein [Marivirga atlantica]